MNNRESLFSEIDKRYHRKNVYEKRENYNSKREKFYLPKAEHNLIKTRVEMMCKEISKKYEIEESQTYEKLYLRVRKLFLELM